MTEEDAVLRRVMHLHGFGMMNTVLKDFKNDKEVLQLVSSISVNRLTSLGIDPRLLCATLT